MRSSWSNVRATKRRETFVDFGASVLKNDQICSLSDKSRRELSKNPFGFAPRQILDAQRNTYMRETKPDTAPHHERIFISALNTFSSGRAFQMTFRAAP
jgi:hypothetical protein